MSKTINTNIKFGYGSGTGDWTGIEDSKTSEPYSEGWWGIYPPYPPYYEMCWHRLPCGDCQLTGRPCTHGGYYTTNTYKITSDTKTED